MRKASASARSAFEGDQDNTVTDAEAAKRFVGIAVLDPTQSGDIYAQNAIVAVMKKGVIWVQASVAVAVNDPVYFVPATGVLTNVASSNTQIANASWGSSVVGAGLAKLPPRLSLFERTIHDHAYS